MDLIKISFKVIYLTISFFIDGRLVFFNWEGHVLEETWLSA